MKGLAKVLLVSVLVFLAAFRPAQERGAAGQSATGFAPSMSPSEFPPYDYQVWRLALAGEAIQAAARLIAASAANPATVEALANQGRWDDVFQMMERIIAGDPGKIAMALDSFWPQYSRLRPDDFQRMREKLRATASAARKRLPDLSRTEASELAYRLLKIDRDAQNPIANLRAFIQEYPGTEAAANAEVEAIINDHNLRTPERIRELDKYISEHRGTRACARALYQKGCDIGNNMNVRDADPTDRFMQVFEIVKELERGRYLLEAGKRVEAIAALEQITKQFPDSPNVGEARILIHRARLYEALDLAGEENPKADEAAAMKMLEDLAAQPFDSTVCAAKISLACVLWKQGKADRAQEILSEALAGWQGQQPPQEAPSDLGKEVAAMRSLVFKPSGDALYNGFRFNGPRFLPASSLAYVIVNPEVRVKLADGIIARVTVHQSFPGLDKVLFADSEQLALLRDLLNRLGGTKKREPGSFMETPNQPFGASMSILDLFKKFFPAFPGHWGGWEFLTYPNVTQITFLNKELTGARVSVTIGYAGADVIMEKVNGKWQAKGLTNQWVT